MYATYVTLDQNQQLVNIEKIKKGLACHCTCLECGEPSLQKIDKKEWGYPINEIKQQKPKNISDLQQDDGKTNDIEATHKSFKKYRMTIHEVWVDVLVFDSGILSVRSVGYNPQIIALLKSWRNQGGGQYNVQYQRHKYSLNKEKS